jgi:hypothetical protein
MLKPLWNVWNWYDCFLLGRSISPYWTEGTERNFKNWNFLPKQWHSVEVSTLFSVPMPYDLYFIISFSSILGPSPQSLSVLVAPSDVRNPVDPVFMIIRYSYM